MKNKKQEKSNTFAAYAKEVGNGRHAFVIRNTQNNAGNETLLDPLLYEITSDEMSSWYKYLNLGFGVAAFTAAFACLGTRSPSVYAIFCMAFLLLVRNQELFPPHLTALRALGHPEAKALRKLIEKNFFNSWSARARTFPFLFGYVALCLVIVEPIIGALGYIESIDFLSKFFGFKLPLIPKN